jgi:hypothetical protein
MFENTYNQDLHDVTITFNLEQLPFRTINSPNQIYLDSIKANSKIEVTKLIGVSSEALSKIYSIPITINYKNQDLTSEYLKTYNFGIQVYNKEPIIDLVNVAISEDRLKPGKDYEVELNIRNNFNSDLYDIVVTLGSQTSPFQIINSANQIYVDSLKGGSQISVSRKIIISPEAEAKVHSIPVTIKYKNTDLSKEYQKVYDFGMIVDVNNLIETHLLKNEVKSTNSSGTVTLNIINKENSKIKFVEAEILESNDDSYHLIDQTRKKYIGNLDSDDYDSVDFNIKVDKKHPTLRLKVTAQDAYNNNIEKIFEIPLEIYSEKEAIDRGIIPNPTADGFASMAGPIIILLILSIFWLFMIINAISQEYDVPSKKYLWIATVVLTHALGAILFYFFGKRK